MERKYSGYFSKTGACVDGTSTVLVAAILDGQWNTVMGRAKHSPSEIEMWVDDELPIHIVCKLNPPVSIVKVLAKAGCVDALDGDNNLPLHIAIKHDANIRVIRLLTEQYPASLSTKDADGNTPYDLAHLRTSHDDNEYRLLAQQVIKHMDWVRGGGGEKKQEKKQKSMWRSFRKQKSHEKPGTFFEDVKVASSVSSRFPKEVEKVDKGLKTSSEDGKDEEAGSISTSVPKETIDDLDMMEGESGKEGWQKSGLTVIIIGASGDLAKKKTYPSLLDLYDGDHLPVDTSIWGFARSSLTHEDLRARLKPYLMKTAHDEGIIDSFLERCFYHQGKSYGDVDAMKTMTSSVRRHELQSTDHLRANRMYYFAIPPNVFAEAGIAIKQVGMAENGWTRIVVEKPFGRDLQSYEVLSETLSKNFSEHHLYRIDHYLGKEMVQNLLIMRFSNIWFERLWNRDSVQCIIITFKEPFGTDGRGGYFDQYGIIRDILQNHLLQVLTLLTMEPPIKVDGPEGSQSIRDAKVQVLKSMPPITLDDCLLGQYEGYTDDETITNKDTNTPTFAAISLHINNPRWAGVPIIMKAGKSLDERKAEMRIQFKDAPAADFLFDSKTPRNELVIVMQPEESIYMKSNVKTPGFSAIPVQSELDLNYDTRFFENDEKSPAAYTRLLLDVLRGRQAAFVRDDELRRSWEIFTPLLHQIENSNVRPVMYKQGSRGPKEADDFISEKSGYVRNENYVYKDSHKDGSVAGKKSNTT
mmetsp:Transcript_33328/g.40320  ORF Transcript_33328/g.40320 Transcript_33328/m.40320 type:complete len:752 (+) Transcript_33328:104-2359(+)|eukprot:CAMPEP_0194365474 /NCGR_PEP_ID=MMETSP0174-20130528/13532_1 /TAXON_ID=216777 /ORGANISM="Proboscia alata, Strain PI-D3" /LENGTH=751 /DNA_ID=CAMNT_0039140193 /DNA_START=60 /DNA_END=2315 /DNA_ORIENTATION=+